MKKIVFSVIVPAYNEENNIRDCLLSLKNQKTKHLYEIILVDNNSTDKTSQIARKMGVRVIKEVRQGRPFARQTGADKAKGAILVYTEADCVAPNNWLHEIGDFFVNNPKYIAFAGSYKFLNSTPVLSFIGPKTVSLSSFIYKLFTGNNTLRGTNFAIRKSFVKKIGKFRIAASPLDDVDYGFRAGKYGPIAYLPSIWVYTQDRRVRGRLMNFIWEFISSFVTVFFFKRPGGKHLYSPIR